MADYDQLNHFWPTHFFYQLKSFFDQRSHFYDQLKHLHRKNEISCRHHGVILHTFIWCLICWCEMRRWWRSKGILSKFAGQHYIWSTYPLNYPGTRKLHVWTWKFMTTLLIVTALTWMKSKYDLLNKVGRTDLAGQAPPSQTSITRLDTLTMSTQTVSKDTEQKMPKLNYQSKN